MPKMVIGLVALTALVGAACGGSGATGATGGISAGCTADNATDLTGDDPFVITLVGLAYDPNCFAAKSASSISIVNKGIVPHTFTIDGTPVDVTIPRRQTFNGESVGLAPGTYPFHCKIHSTMKGTVIVS